MNRWKSLPKSGHILLCVALALALLAATASVVNGQHEIPMVAWGIVYINGAPAEDGTLVEAKIGGEVVASGYTYTEGGEQGHYVLSIEGEGGDKVHFFVLGVEAEESPKSWAGGTYHLDLHIELRAHLVVEITAPEAVNVGTTFDVSATVSNTGEADATDVTVTLSVTGGASLVEGETPEKPIGDLSGGATSDPVSWTLRCTSAEDAVITVTPAGIDAYTGNAIPQDNLVSDEVTIHQTFTIYLPLIMKNYSP